MAEIVFVATKPLIDLLDPLIVLYCYYSAPKGLRGPPFWHQNSIDTRHIEASKISSLRFAPHFSPFASDWFSVTRAQDANL
jgi:hypothetical protein